MEFACEAAIYDSKRSIYAEFEFLFLRVCHNYSAMNCGKLSDAGIKPAQPT